MWTMTDNCQHHTAVRKIAANPGAQRWRNPNQHYDRYSPGRPSTPEMTDKTNLRTSTTVASVGWRIPADRPARRSMSRHAGSCGVSGSIPVQNGEKLTIGIQTPLPLLLT